MNSKILINICISLVYLGPDCVEDVILKKDDPPPSGFITIDYEPSWN